mgnify:CR=1 FL=1|jgi:hypothetical protein
MSFSIPPLKPFSSSTAYIGFFDGSTIGQPPLRRPGKLNLFMQGPSGINDSLDLYLENSARTLINSGIDLYLKNGQGNNISGGVPLTVYGYNNASGDITLYLPNPNCCTINDPIFVDANGNPTTLPPVYGGGSPPMFTPPAYPQIKQMSNCGITYVTYYECTAVQCEARIPTGLDYDYSFSGYLNIFNLSVLPRQVLSTTLYAIKAVTIDDCGNSGNILSGIYLLN